MAIVHAQSRTLAERGRLTLTCVSIVANALCAGGVFTFPLISPALSSHLKLTQPQLTTIVLAGMIGQYPLAAFVGEAIDQHGPWVCSLAASILFSAGFGLFSWEISKTPDDITAPSSSSFQRLTVFYFLAGLGTVTSYFSFLFAASKNFPNYLGIASGTTMALFGLSPLFLSILASMFFTDETGLKVTQYVAFMAILAGTTNFIGALTIQTPVITTVTMTTNEAADDMPVSTDETTPLVPSNNVVRGPVVKGVSVDGNQPLSYLFKDPSFWILAMIIVLTIGACEMVISNIGTITLSLPSVLPTITASAPPTAITATQVRLLSISNTLSRLLVGPLADFVSPVASYLPCGTAHYVRKHRISRVAFLSGSCLLLIFTFGWMDFKIRSQQGIWLLSLGTGIAYGSIFTILPSIVSSVWGLANLGRNFGVITYAPFIGTPIFSYLYAFVSASPHKGPNSSPHPGGELAVCQGARCWQLTFTLTTVAAMFSFFGSLVLWKRWKGQV